MTEERWTDGEENEEVIHKRGRKMTDKEFSENGPSDDTHVLHVTFVEGVLIKAVMDFLLSNVPDFAKDTTLFGVMKNISKKCDEAFSSQEKRMIKNAEKYIQETQ